MNDILSFQELKAHNTGCSVTNYLAFCSPRSPNVELGHLPCLKNAMRCHGSLKEQKNPASGDPKMAKKGLRDSRTKTLVVEKITTCLWTRSPWILWDLTSAQGWQEMFSQVPGPPSLSMRSWMVTRAPVSSGTSNFA